MKGLVKMNFSARTPGEPGSPALNQIINLTNCEIEFVERYGARNAMRIVKRAPDGSLDVDIEIRWEE